MAAILICFKASAIGDYGHNWFKVSRLTAAIAVNVLKQRLYFQLLALLAIPFLAQILLLFWYGSLISKIQTLEGKQARADK